MVAAGVFHSIDHGKHNPAATALIIGLVTLCAYGKVPPVAIQAVGLRQHDFLRAVSVPQQSGCALIHRFDHSGIPPQICFLIAVVFSFAMAIIITNRIEQPITNGLRNAWNRYRTPKKPDTDVATAS